MFPRPTSGVLVFHVTPQSSEMAIKDKLNPSEYKGTISRVPSSTNGCARVIHPSRRKNLSAACFLSSVA
jgi:hypothetical protein